MTTIPLRSATPFASSSYKTPFGYFDDDPAFIADADSMVEYVRRRLGAATVSTEITEHDVYACFEEATFEFSSYVNVYQARDLLLDYIGVPSASVDGQNIPHHSMRLMRHYTQAYEMGFGGGSYTLHSASTTYASAQQHKNIRQELVDDGNISSDDILYIKDVYYASNVQVYRLFNTTSAMNYLNREFNFSSYVPEVMFSLLPVWEDVLRTQEFKASDRLRRSNYTYQINNGVLSVYPAPSSGKVIWFTYRVEPMGSSSIYNSSHYESFLHSSGSVVNVSNAPLSVLPYGSLNYMAKQFIKRITLALCKELLGRVRSKFLSLPIPDGEVTLDGTDLKSEAATELDNIRNDLKEWLESLTQDALLAREREKQESIVSVYQYIPMHIIKG